MQAIYVNYLTTTTKLLLLNYYYYYYTYLCPQIALIFIFDKKYNKINIFIKEEL